MEQTHTGRDYKDDILVIRRRSAGRFIWLASARERAQKFSGLDFKMRLFLTTVTVVCFSFGTLCGANLHTLADMRQNNIIAAKLINMPIRELAEISI